MKKTVLVALVSLATQITYAQYSADALRFSQLNNSSTARFDATGGNKTAVGGDLSSLFGNPAGLGMFSKSEFSITPGFNINSSDIQYLGNPDQYRSSQMSLNNVGVVFHTKTYKESDTKKGLLSLNFGIGYQRKNAFGNRLKFGGETFENGISDYFTENSNAEGSSGVAPTPQNLNANTNYGAYLGFLTNYSNGVYSNLTFADADQMLDLKRSGGSSTVDFMLGGNVSNNFFFGIGVGLASFRYTSVEQTNEQGLLTKPGSQNSEAYNVTYRRNFDSEGSGLNLKLGLIFKPVTNLRLGLSVESPTWYTVEDNYSEEFLNANDSYVGLDSYPFEYNLNTPLKLNGGLAYFFGSKGFISADFGYVDYSKINFDSDDFNTNISTQNAIGQNYQNAFNWSIGGEARLSKDFLMRLGYQYQSNPYEDANDDDFDLSAFSGGLGYRFGNYFLDAALVNSSNKLIYKNYTLNNNSEPVADIATRRNTISLTFGIRF